MHNLFQACYLISDYERKYLDNWLGNIRVALMSHIDFFKLQAKNLFRDYKTQTTVDGLYTYSPKYFDIESIFCDYHDFFDTDGWDEGNLTLMKIQHFFSYMLGFKKWADLVNASEAELELAKLLFDNQHKIHREDWETYVASTELDNNTIFDAEDRVEIFKHVFAHVDGHHSTFCDYRLKSS